MIHSCLTRTRIKRNLGYCEVLWSPRKNSLQSLAKFYGYNEFGYSGVILSPVEVKNQEFKNFQNEFIYRLIPFLHKFFNLQSDNYRFKKMHFHFIP